MKFQMTGIFSKVLWQGERSTLCLFKETIKDKTYDWALFCQELPEENKIYDIEGLITKSVSKKYKNEKGHSATEYSFNVYTMKRADGSDEFVQSFPGENNEPLF